MTLLGVNIDHVATLRQARGGIEPSVVEAAIIAQNSGADGITVHLREDRRHIQDKDLYDIKKVINIPLNLEMACSKEIVEIAIDVKPRMCTLVPEKRQEITTEGGLDVVGLFDKVSSTVKSLQKEGIIVSLFIEPDINQIDATKDIGAEYIEIHTGKYANEESINQKQELDRIISATSYAVSKNIKVNAGHGLNYDNVKNISMINNMNELNIGHSIISKAVFSGLSLAISEMKRIISS